jgi:hypothetical protein
MRIDGRTDGRINTTKPTGRFARLMHTCLKLCRPAIDNTHQHSMYCTNKLQTMELLCICATLVPSVLGAAPNPSLRASGSAICQAVQQLTVASNLLTCGIKHSTSVVHDSTSLEDKDHCFQFALITHFR